MWSGYELTNSSHCNSHHGLGCAYLVGYILKLPSLISETETPINKALHRAMAKLEKDCVACDHCGDCEASRMLMRLVK